MNRTDRLLAIVLELQARGNQRGEDLAATFEVSKRTIYRDIEALCQAGVPVVAVPGRGYSLVKGYFLPPLQFTVSEAMMLLLGSDFMSHNFDAEYRFAAESAGRKIGGVLPESVREEVRELRESIRFVVAGGLQRTGKAEVLGHLRSAIGSRHTLQFAYRTKHSEDGNSKLTIRQADPYGLIHVAGSWMVVAYCHTRKAIRHFRIDRMSEVRLLNRTFERPADFDVQRHRPEGRREIEVQALFDHDSAQWARESPSFFRVCEEEREDGLLVTLHVRHEREVLQWLLGWGRHVRVLKPDSLRLLIAEEARAILHENAIPESLLT